MRHKGSIVLQTDRLLLRRFTDADAQDLQRVAAFHDVRNPASGKVVLSHLVWVIGQKMDIRDCLKIKNQQQY